MSFCGVVAGQPLSRGLLLDTGASCSLMSAAASESLKLRVRKLDNINFMLPNGRESPTLGKAIVTIHCQGTVLIVPCLVTKLSDLE